MNLSQLRAAPSPATSRTTPSTGRRCRWAGRCPSSCGAKAAASATASPNDFGLIPQTLPAFLATINTGRFGTYFDENGGSFAQILKDWILYRINADTTSAKRFVGPTCGQCTTPNWQVKSRNIF